MSNYNVAKDKQEAIEVAKKAFQDGAGDVSVFYEGRNIEERRFIHQIAGQEMPTEPTNWFLFKNGNGNDPLIYITKEIYQELKADGLLDDDCYGGFHNRHIYDFKKEKIL